jgi:hypothetical protein
MDNIRPGDPLPKPNQERLDLPDEQHLDFWRLIIREFNFKRSREQSHILYRNVINAPYEGEIGS